MAPELFPSVPGMASRASSIHNDKVNEKVSQCAEGQHWGGGGEGGGSSPCLVQPAVLAELRHLCLLTKFACLT